MSALHETIGKRAFELLPQWEQDFWAPEQENIPTYCVYPDTHLECQWGDVGKLPFYEHYCMLPDGHCVPHGMVDSDWTPGSFSGREMDAEHTAYVLEYYCKTIIDLLRAGDVVESARFAGTLGHYIQDVCNLGHCFNNILLNRLFPAENGKQPFFHRSLDGWPFFPEKITKAPKLVGTTRKEAVFCMTEMLMCKLEDIAGICVPFLTAIQNEDIETADGYSQAMNEDAVWYTASLWHTLFCIAFDKATAADREAFKVRDLTDSKMILSYDKMFNREQFIDAGIPFYPSIYHNFDPCRARLAIGQYPYEPTLDYAVDKEKNVIPLKLNIDGKPVTGMRGIAGSTYTVASFRVPGDLYAELDVYAGIHPDSSTNGELVFAVWCHEAQEKLLAKGVTTRDGQTLHFKVELPENCRTISLVNAGEPGEKSAIWMEPKLKSRIHK